MIETTLYIDDVKVDMFPGTNLTLNDSIKKTTDVANVSTSFTRQFKLPASKTNNKLFQHYYNTLIRNGFDSRRKHDALIKLNGADFRKGYIKLNGVELENNKAKSYSIQFFGEMSSIKDRMGEDMLEDLTYLARYNHDYNQATVKSAFEQGLKSTGGGLIVDPDGELIYPFISHTRGFKFDSNGLYDVTQGGTPTSADRLSYDDLKPAVKVNEVLSAMEYKYDLSFIGDFRDGDMFQELFLWLHREKGFVRNGSEVDNNNFAGAITPDGVANPVEQEYALDSGDEQRPLQTYGQVGGQLGKNYKCRFEVQTADAGTYQMAVVAIPTFTNGEPQVYVLDNQSGNSDPLEFDLFSFGVGLDIEFWEVWTYVYAENTISTLTPIVTVDEYFGDTLQDTGVYGNTAEGIVKYIDVPVNMPKMKCIDFLRGLMRMFNLVAYDVPKGDTDAGYDIVLQPLDDFYDSGTAVDLTKWVDISNSSVQRVEPFNLIEFSYPDPQTLFAKKSNEVQRINFGNAKFDSSALSQGDTSLLYDGGSYTVDVDFEKAQYERIENGTTSTLTQLQWGWFVNDFEENEPEPEIGEPLLFFRNVRDCDVDEIEWTDASTTNTTYNAPSNVSTDQEFTLNFDAEVDEYTLEVNENGLFNKFYKRFIEGIYDIDARRYKVELYLPPKYLFDYRLNDKVYLNYTPFNIENIAINTLNGKTSLELLKITARDEVYDVEPTIDIPVKNLVFYSRFDSDTDDETGNHTPTSTDITYGTTGTPPPSGLNFAEFDLNTSEVTIPHSSDLNFGDGTTDQPFSISFWMRYTDNSGAQNMVIKGQDIGTNREYRIWSSTNITWQLFDNSTNANIRLTTPKAANNVWIHYVFTYDGSGLNTGMTAYRNGVEDTLARASTGAYTAMEDLGEDVMLGKDPAGTSVSLDGDMDSFAVWNKELTPTEITNIYNAQSDGFELL